MITGLRVDFHNLYGTLFTPRFHFRYKINESTTLRISAGKGYKSANVIAENISLLASSRELIFEETLDIEEAWNYGIIFTQYT